MTERVTLYEVRSPQKDKLSPLRQLLLSFGDESSIVFLNYRDAVERTSDYLRREGFVVSCFHGGLDQREREAALYRFSNGSANVLVATDLASRGLDIPNIRNIVHYHLPESEEGYVHRVGRTARWDATGRAFFLLGPGERIPEYVTRQDSLTIDHGPLTIEHGPLTIEHYELPPVAPSVEPTVTPSLEHAQRTMGNGQWSMVNGQRSMVNDSRPALPRMATVYVGKGKKDKLSKGDIVGFLCKTAGLTAADIGRIDVKDRYTYVAVRRECLAQVLRLTAGEKIKGLRTVIEPAE